jgi:hemerythrin-like metal-binding protein
MPILQWHDNVYSIGVDEIDRQHKELVQMINSAHECARSGGDSGETLALVRAMLDYATEHFATEEAMMRGAGYHGMDAHLGEHGEFEAKAQEYGDALRNGEVPNPLEVFRFLAHWLGAHILEVDAEFGRFLKRADSGREAEIGKDSEQADARCRQ